MTTESSFADQSLAIEAIRRQVQLKTASGARQMVCLRPDEADSLLDLIDDFFLGTELREEVTE